MHRHFRWIRVLAVALLIASSGQNCIPPVDDVVTPSDCPLPTPPAGSFAIIDISPCDGATNVPVNTSITVTFNGSADPPTLSGLVRPSDDVDLVWSNNNSQLRIDFPAGLQADTTYTVILSDCRDVAGQSLWQQVSICFSTGATVGQCHTPIECQAPSATDPNVPAYTDYSFTKPFAASSPFNTPIGDDPSIDPASDTIMSGFTRVAGSFGGLWLGFGQDQPPIYFADASTPTHDVNLTSPWTPIAVRTGVPIPAYAIPDCGNDNFMVVLDTVNNLYWDFWQVTEQQDGSWSGSWASSISNSSDGIFPGGSAQGTQGVRVSQFALIAGAIWPQELAAGTIEHALVFVYPETRSGVYSSPAKGTDGTYEGADTLPIGARLQLDPTLDLDSLGLAAHERTIAEALQTYGMYCVDTGGGISLPLVHPYSFAGNPYENLLPASTVQEGGTLLSNIPADRFRVLEMTLIPTN